VLLILVIKISFQRPQSLIFTIKTHWVETKCDACFVEKWKVGKPVTILCVT
jgi:hypothetical protein